MRALAEIDMGGGRGKRKRTSTEKAQQQISTEVVPPPKKKKKKRAPKEKTQAQKDESAKLKRARNDRRNALGGRMRPRRERVVYKKM